MNIHEKVLRKISPSDNEIKRVTEIVEEVRKVAAEISGLEAMALGSTGKFTWLSGDHDIDIFILFPKTVSREELEEKGLKFGELISKKLGGKAMVKYAEHPYTHTIYKGYDIDIVPCCDIRKGEKIVSAVDRSPLHLEFVLEKLKKNQQDEVRLLKQFMKGVGVYGSDAKNLGFSGYVCELLIIKYGSFEKTLRYAKNWQAQERITLNSGEMKKFKDDALVIIDPTDENRNAASIISSDNFFRFIRYSNMYLKKPSLEYFFPKTKPLSVKETDTLKKRGSRFIALEMNRPDIIDDILYFQVRRALKRITKYLEYNEFKTFRSFELVGDKVYFVFELEIWNLPNVKKMTGPSIFSRKHVKEFTRKYDKTYVENLTWMADKDREFKTPELLLKDFLKQSENELKESGIPGKIVSDFKKVKLLDEKQFLVIAKKFPNKIRRIYFD